MQAKLLSHRNTKRFDVVIDAFYALIETLAYG